MSRGAAVPLVSRHARDIRAVVYERETRLIHPAPPDRTLSAAFARDQHVIRGPVGPALQREQQAIEPAPLAVAHLRELRTQVVLIENEALAEQAVQPADRKENVRRVADMDGVEADLDERCARQQHDRGQAVCILEQMPEGATWQPRDRVEGDRDPPLGRLERVTRIARADHGDAVTGAFEGARDLLDARVVRIAHVLDHDQHPQRPRADATARSRRRQASGAPRSRFDIHIAAPWLGSFP